MQQSRAVQQQPDILLLYSDQHAAKIAGHAGDGVVRTPNLDALAAQGVRMTNAYCPSPICLPSRMSFLTGKAPIEQACWTNRDILPSSLPTFAHSLGAAGYAPWLCGRMHSIGPDQMRGYTRRDVGDHSPNWLGGSAHDLGPLARANDPWRESLRASGAGRSAYETYDNAVTEAAVAMLHEAGERRRAGDRQPLALTVGWILPHAPYVCDPALYEYYAGRVSPPAIAPPDRDSEHPHYRWWRENRQIADATQTEIARARAAYYGLVETLDVQVGQVMAALEESGLSENTLVIYLSDHGEHLGERGLWWKSTLYDESAKVPLIVKGPGLPRGQTRDAVVNLTDLTATLLDLARAPALPGSHGRSFADLLHAAETPWQNQTFCEYVNDGVPPWAGGREVIQRMVRLGRYKYIYHHGLPGQLFDLEDDPDEVTDLAGDPGHAAVAQRLRALVLADWDPRAISDTLEQRREQYVLLERWAQATRPDDLIRWTMHAADSWLDDPPPET